MGISNYWATFRDVFLWWKTETKQVEAVRVFTKYPRELLQDRIPCNSNLCERVTMGELEHGGTVWPFSKSIPQYRLGSQVLALSTFDEMKQRLAPCVHLIDPNAGDIIPLMAANLNHEAAENVGALLPRPGYAHAYQVPEITAECKDMLRPMMELAQKQHAHNLKVNGMVDILIKWNCGEMVCDAGSSYANEQRLLVRKRDWDVFKKAWDYRYKVLEWDENYIKNTPNPTCGKDITRPIPGRKSGFYAVVTDGHYKELKHFADIYRGKIDLTVLIQPRRMTAEEQAEMEQYHTNYSTYTYKAPSLSKTMEGAKEEQEREEREYHQRKKNTFAAARKRDVDKYEKLDFRVGYSF